MSSKKTSIETAALSSHEIQNLKKNIHSFSLDKNTQTMFSKDFLRNRKSAMCIVHLKSLKKLDPKNRTLKIHFNCSLTKIRIGIKAKWFVINNLISIQSNSLRNIKYTEITTPLFCGLYTSFKTAVTFLLPPKSIIGI